MPRVEYSTKEARMDGKLAQAVNSAVEEVLSSQEEPQPETPAEGAAETEASTPATPAEEPASDAGPENEGTQPEGETPEEGETPQAEDVPESYFGLDLSEFPPETRKAIIDRAREQDKLIQSQQRKLAEQQKQLEGETPAPREPEGEAPAPTEPQAPSDEDILKALGLDPEDPMYEVKKELSLPLAKQLIAQQQQFQALQQKVSEFEALQQNQATLAYWNETLDALEQDYGKLPYSREDIFDYALENEVFDPTDVFFRLQAPQVKQLYSEITKAREEARRTAKRTATSTRPRGTAPTDTKEVRKGNVRQSVTEAAKLAAEELGVGWEEAIQEAVATRGAS